MCLILPLLFILRNNGKGRRRLSGGGAKEWHISKHSKGVIEEAGIPIDYIVGTSNGIYSRWTLRYRLYSRTTGQYGSQARLDFPLSDRIKRSAMSFTEP